MKRRKCIASRLHSAAQPKSRLGEKLRRASLKRTAKEQKPQPKRAREAEAEASGHGVLRHRLQATMSAWVDRQDGALAAATQPGAERAVA